jgi:hypothetical protein
MLGVGACAIAFFFAQTIRNSNDVVSFKAPVTAPSTNLIRNPQPVAPDKRDKIVYPYSVIPGGVRSRNDLTSSIRDDKVIAAHFADFDISQARIVNVEETKFVHVSYRIRDKVYWTAKAIKLPKGETLITDGRNLARTRCGNRVSFTPQQPVYQQEPALETFDIPQLARLEIPELLNLETGLQVQPVPRLEPYMPVQPPKIVPYYYRPFFGLRRSSNEAVPEPGTLSMLVGGLALAAIVRYRRKK